MLLTLDVKYEPVVRACTAAVGGGQKIGTLASGGFDVPSGDCDDDRGDEIVPSGSCRSDDGEGRCLARR